MVYLKNKQEIEIMRKAENIATTALREIAKNIKPGVKTIELDRIAENKIRALGAISSFKKVEGYRHSICTTPNDWVVHGIPSDTILKEKDCIGIDLGAYYKGYHSDLAQTFVVGKIDAKKRHFLETGKRALTSAIKQVRVGKRIGDISETIQQIIEGEGYSFVRELVGHGVGKQLHEDPLIPGRGKKGTGEEMKEGMVLAIEVIYNMGKNQVKLLSDGWTISTKDGSLSGLFERTVAVTKKGPLVLTPLR